MNHKKNSLVADIQAFIISNDLISSGSTVIIGLSGGPDSVVLTHILVQLRATHHLTLIAAHLNHGWRPEAPEDALFCQQLARELDIPYEQAHLNDFKDTLIVRGSCEDLGRQARRIFFEHCARKYNASCIALAHHTDDQQETFFIRMIRGATLSGLVGMHVQHGKYVRPLLYVKKQAILAYLEEHALAYRIDATNADTRYLRNKIRHTVLPALNACDNRFDENFARMLVSLQATERFMERCARKAFAEVIHVNAQYGMGLTLKQLHVCEAVIRDRVIMLWLQHHKVPYVPQERFIQEIVRFLSHERGGVHRMHARWHILKKQGYAYIQSLHSVD